MSTNQGPLVQRAMNHLGGFQLLPPKPGVCQECAVGHASDQPHNQQSLFYQYAFYGVHGRWPKWADAMAHCPEDVKVLWIRELAKKGVAV